LNYGLTNGLVVVMFTELDQNNKSITILSLGVGVNSIALLVLGAQGKVHFDEAVFADTGSEQPETYEYWQNVVIPFCFDNGINLARINKEGKVLYDDNFEKQIIPTRAFRSCRVLKKYALAKYGKANQVNFIIGFASDEKERADNCVLGNKYPLIEMGIDREGCKRIIRTVKMNDKQVGLPVPVKSGCWFCPFQSEASWLRLLKKHPDLYMQAELLEQHGSRYPEMYLAYPDIGRLDALKNKYEANQKIQSPEKKATQRLLFCPMCELSDEEGEVDYTGYKNFHLQVTSK
jgi:hypothetical protein